MSFMKYVQINEIRVPPAFIPVQIFVKKKPHRNPFKSTFVSSKILELGFFEASDIFLHKK